jgi:ubiquitin C-terminal hydrolase
MNISLPLTALSASSSSVGGGLLANNLSVERCLHQFVATEKLAESVECQKCGRATVTKRQRVIASLPTVLCFHFKRFDTINNLKIQSYVSFPARGLNMGPFLPHWCEVTQAVDTAPAPVSAPRVLYNLYGTVNHAGNLHAGHYTANVLAKNVWYTCNDAHVRNRQW